MAGTFSKIYIQFVFAVKGRQSLLLPSKKEEINKYISGIITAKGQKSIIVNGMPDHIHVFVGLDPAMRMSDLVRDIKANSSKFINEQNWLNKRFEWQQGYGAFSYSRWDVDTIYRYILNQEKHHAEISFRNEYLKLLEQFEIEFKDEYLFDFL